ncbi:hypothetical protein [Actinopolyspora mortivallis]|uniref:Uncharacterized protein n=1 Tax=Actinopolyspora mortivallis TaxID=33906 RepID=A0A2T0GV28_ACTMO|nr:hypothetical protein [Actinopolyspora mortivallis]PRW62950.1 hypothetical protein CEP50_12825 [Actinopolyspora mortivallis]
MRGPIVRLVYERTSPPGVDAGVEPLIAVCATEEEAEHLEQVSSSRGRYALWEEHPLQGAAGRTTPLVDGEMVHLVLLGDVDADPRDPIGIAVHTDRQAAERHAAEQAHSTGDADYYAVSLPIGWRAES